MEKFLLTYLDAGKPESPEEGKKLQQEWMEWVMSLGSAMVNPGTPVKASKFIDKNGVTDGSGPHQLNGFSIFEAENFDKALEIVNSCPHKKIGSMILSQIMDMPSK